MNNQILQMIIRITLVLFVFIGILTTTIFTWMYLYPFVIALLLSAVFQPFIRLLDNHLHFPKTFAILLVLFLFCSLTGAFATLLVAELIKGVQYLALGVPHQFSQLISHISNEFMRILYPLINKIESLNTRLSIDEQQSLDTYVKLAQEKVNQTGMDMLQALFESLGGILTQLPSSFTTFFITLLATFFICKDWDRITAFCKKIMPVFVSDRMSIFRSELYRTIKGIIKAQCTLVMISTITIAIGLYVIGASHVLTITLLTAFVDFIPYVGTGIIFLPWILYHFFSGNFAMTISLSILYMVVMVTRQALEPKLLATHFGVPPILLLISLFLGFQLFGGFGMLISPIVLMMIQTINKTGVGRELWIYIKRN